MKRKRFRVSEYNPKYPKLIVDLSKAGYSFGVESKVHGQMKAHGFPRTVRQELTKEIREANTFEEQVIIARRWVTVK